MIAHIDVDSFLVAVERARNPELTGRAVVIGGRPGSRGLVASASREARRAGIRPGMPLEQASIRCPDAVFLAGAFDAYLAAARHVDDILRRESSDIEWNAIDDVFVGMAGDAVRAVERIQQRLQSMGLDAGCGLARTKVVARIASRLARPRGVLHVLNGYEARFLSPLKIEMLPGVDAAIAQRLRAGGIRRLGQLAHLSPAQIAPLAGRAAATLARQAAGLDFTPLHRASLPPASLEDRLLAEPTADADVLHRAIDERVAHLAHELRIRGMYARTITVRLHYADGRSESRSTRLSEPSALTEVLQTTAWELLAQRARPERLVRAVGVSGTGLLDAAGEVALFPRF